MHKLAFTLVVIRVRIWNIRDMTFLNRTHFYLTWTSGTSGIAYENMFTFVVKHVRRRIVADFIDFYDYCEPDIRPTVHAASRHKTPSLTSLPKDC